MFKDPIITIDVEHEGQLLPPLRRHIFYYFKWYFFIKPKLLKEIGKAQAQARATDEILGAHILSNRINKK
jgi:hypothetical protein